MVLKKPIDWPIQVHGSETATFDLHFARFDDKRYVVGVLGEVDDGVPLVRIESACIFGHVFRGVHCDCGSQWEQAIERIIDVGKGILIYSIDDDARGHGIEAHFDLYVHRQYGGITDEEEIFDMWGTPMDVREYSPVIEILETLGVDAVRIMTNNPERIAVLEDAGIEVAEQIRLEAKLTKHNYELLLDEKEWMDYQTSYLTHDEWREEFTDRANGQDGFMLVQQQREVIAEAFSADWESNVPEVDDQDLLTLYATPSVAETVSDSLGDALTEVVPVKPERPVAIQSDD